MTELVTYWPLVATSAIILAEVAYRIYTIFNKKSNSHELKDRRLRNELLDHYKEKTDLLDQEVQGLRKEIEALGLQYRMLHRETNRLRRLNIKYQEDKRHDLAAIELLREQVVKLERRGQ